MEVEVLRPGGDCDASSCTLGVWLNAALCPPSAGALGSSRCLMGSVQGRLMVVAWRREAWGPGAEGQAREEACPVQYWLVGTGKRG